jgi:hypothetical protein
LFIRSEMTAARLSLEEKLQQQTSELMHHSPESTLYKIICAEIVSITTDLIRLSWDITSYSNAVNVARDKQK